MESPTRSSGKVAFDLCVAYGVLLAAGVLTFLFYLPLHQQQTPLRTGFPAIEAGSSRATLMSRGACAGEVVTTLSAEETPTLQSKLHLRTFFEGKESATTATLSAYFNPLLQLARGQVTVESPLFSVTLSAADVTPLRLSVSGRLRDTTRSFELIVPGPITLVKIGPTTFQIEYPRLPTSLDSGAATAFLRTLADDLALSVVANTAGSGSCETGATGAIDITSIIERLRPLSRAHHVGENL